jgi:hypothetical protein
MWSDLRQVIVTILFTIYSICRIKWAINFNFIILLFTLIYSMISLQSAHDMERKVVEKKAEEVKVVKKSSALSTSTAKESSSKTAQVQLCR